MKQLTNTSYFPVRRSALVLSVLFFLSVLVSWPHAVYASSCAPWAAKLISLEGEASARKSDDVHWQSVEIDITFCPGDSIQVAANSRAILRLSDHSLMRLDARTTVTFMAPKEEGGFWMTLLKGIGHFMSRVPRTLNIKTPVADAKIEGTEFLIRASTDKIFLTVFEGTVSVKNDAGELKLAQGQSAVVNRGSAPILEALVRPRDAVQWALYYPPVLLFAAKDFENLGVSALSRIAESITSLKQGNRKKALEHLDEINMQIDDTRFLAYRASVRLSVGRVSEALDDLNRAHLLNPDDGNVLTLKALVAVVQNDQASALIYADKAIKAAPDAVGPLLARSYVLQAGFDLDAAREAVEAAVLQSPDHALAWSRLAELRLMFRDLHGALTAAERAVEIDSGLAKIQSVLGFAHLIRIEIDAAKTAFEKAIVMDQGAPMPRLGLGLALIREGALEAGRREIETAAMLNPSHALIRSYLGKAYYEEKRDALALEQYEMAKELDPLDPTPWFYDAILKQSINRPVEALSNLQRSIVLNDYRAVYRSQLLVDEDQAARSASLARIYRDLGFEQLALNEGWKSLNSDPSNYSAHRFLADSYALLPRHEIARVSELLQAQLLQPINTTPIQPQLAVSNLGILDGVGPSGLSFNEFNPLFTRNGMALQINGIAGAQNTWGDDLVISGIQDRMSYSIGQFRYKTDGFRENNDLEQDIFNAFAQFNVSHKTSVQFETRTRKIENGDLNLRIDPVLDVSTFSLAKRNVLDENIYRIGFHHVLDQSRDIVASLIFNKQAEDFIDQSQGTNPTLDVVVASERDGYTAELQSLSRGNQFNVIAGVGYFEEDRTDNLTRTITLLPPPPPIPPPDPIVASSSTSFSVRHSNVYSYVYLKSSDFLTWTLGASADNFNGTVTDKDQFNPKLGAIWQARSTTTLRFAAFRTLKRALSSNQTIEPTHISGFNQFFDDANGSDAWRYGFAVDEKFSTQLDGGFEVSRRDLDVPIAGFSEEEKQDEQLYRAYLFWTLTQQVTLATEYRFNRFKRTPVSGDLNTIVPKVLSTHQIPLKVHYNHPNNLFIAFVTTYVEQKVVFPFFPGEEQSRDSFWLVDLSAGYRFSKRRGAISIGVKNLFDESFRYQDRSFQTSTTSISQFQPNQLVFMRLSLSF